MKNNPFFNYLLIILILNNIYIFSESYSKYINKLISLLENSSKDIRIFARKQLILIGNPLVVKTLKKRFFKLSYKARREAIIIILNIEKEKALNFLLSVLINDKDKGVKNLIKLKIIKLVDLYSYNYRKICIFFKNKKKYKKIFNNIKKYILYKKIEEELLKLISPNESIGYFRGQFNSLRKLKEKCILPLLEIFTNIHYRFIHNKINKNENLKFKLKYLAGEGLIDLREYIKDKNKEYIVEKLKKFVKRYYFLSKDLEEIAIVCLFLLGEKENFNNELRKLMNLHKIYPNDSKILVRIGTLYSKIGNNKKSIIFFKKALSLDPTDSFLYCCLACEYSKLNKKKEALKYLEKAVYYGYDDVEWLKRDGDLKNIRNTPKFKEIIQKLEKKFKKR